jgi:predicted methyltransferase
MRIATHPLLVAALSIAAPYSSMAAPASHAAHHGDTALDAALAASTRSAANVARDQYRHPGETLRFFGIRPDMTVVELMPGGGWYTEILAPYLAPSGTYYAAAPGGKYGEMIAAKLAADPATYGKVRLVPFPAAKGPAAEGKAQVPDGSADLVLTFRNIHNLIMDGEDAAAQTFSDIHRMLKPGGVLGVVDHRLPEDADSAREKTSGYIKTSTVKRLAEAAGFRLDAESDVNANPRDTKDYPQGVWTLPPTLKLGDQDRARYLAIGESDRMTLRFVKPAK